jgi:hypothetical protein
MNPLRSWKIVLCLAGSFAAIGLSGGLIGHRIARCQMEARNNPETWNEHVSREFDRIVKPTPEQGARIQVYLDQAVRELQVIRLETIERSTQVIWRLIAEVEAELTPEQQRAFEVMKPQPMDVTLEVLDLPPDPSDPKAPAP